MFTSSTDCPDAAINPSGRSEATRAGTQYRSVMSLATSPEMPGFQSPSTQIIGSRMPSRIADLTAAGGPTISTA